MKNLRMRRSLVGRLVVSIYGRLPLRGRILGIVMKREGGDMYSISLRDILRRYYGVEARDYAYGSLLIPGMADRHTIIGEYASIGPNVRRFGASHPTDRPSMHPLWYNPALGLAGAADDVDRGPCEIGADCWIGANVTILPGCERIGIGSVIGAGTIVTTSVPDFSIVVGNPGRVVGTRLNVGVRAELLRKKHWLSSPESAALILREIERSDGVGPAGAR